jgi:hypothetical protein
MLLWQIAPAVTRKLFAATLMEAAESELVQDPLLQVPSTAVGGVSALLTSYTTTAPEFGDPLKVTVIVSVPLVTTVS